MHSQAIELAREGPEFWLLINRIVATIPCPKCRRSASNYLLDHPIPDDYLQYRDINGKHIGLFRWTVDFHNWVNRENGKMEMDWIVALNKYSDLLGENSGCSACH